jgi:hypothetical protein
MVQVLPRSHHTVAEPSLKSDLGDFLDVVESLIGFGIEPGSDVPRLHPKHYLYSNVACKLCDSAIVSWSELGREEFQVATFD